MKENLLPCHLCGSMLLAADKEGLQFHFGKKHNAIMGFEIAFNLFKLQREGLDMTIEFLSDILVKLAEDGDTCPLPVQETLHTFINIAKEYLANSDDLRSTFKEETKLTEKENSDELALAEIKTEGDDLSDSEYINFLSGCGDIPDLREGCSMMIGSERKPTKTHLSTKGKKHEQLTLEQRKFCVDVFKEIGEEKGWYERLCAMFRQRFPTRDQLPSREAVHKLKQKLDKFQTIENRPKTGRPRVAVSLVCEQCGYAGKTTDAMRAHKKNHHEPKWECSVCKKLYPRSSKTIHEQQHLPESEKRYKCSQCGRGFGTNKHLNQHFMSIHSDERPHVCQFLCGYTCKLLCNLQKHEKICQRKH